MIPKLSSELSSLLIVSLGFMILIPTEDTFKNMQKTVVSSIADDKPGFKAEGYTLTGIKYSVFTVSLWFAPYLCQTIGARLTVILSSFGFLYYMASYVIETEWSMYSAVVILGIAEGTLAPPESQYLIDCSKPKNVSRNVGIFFSLQRMMQVVGNIFVYFNFEGKKYIDRSTRRSAIFGLMGAIALSIISFIFLPKTTKDSSGEKVSFFKTIKKSWFMLLTPNMLCMSLTFFYNGLQQSFGDGIYGPSIGFTLAFGDSVKGLVALSGISKSIGSFLGFLYPLLLAMCISNQSYARRLLFFSGVLGQLVTYFIAFLILPDSASVGNTHDESFIHPNMYVALLGSLLHGFGDSCLVAQVYSFIGDYFRESSGEGTVLYKCLRNIFVALSYYWCSHLGLHIQVLILSVMAVVGVIGCFFAESISERTRCTQSENPSERCRNMPPVEKSST